jgi:hypothetical protein
MPTIVGGMELKVPPPGEIVARIASCRDELRALKNLLRLAKAAQQAEQARQARQALPLPWQEVPNAAR